MFFDVIIHFILIIKFTHFK